ncbi:MAG: GerMN domain-containing protein [Spirochaetaceae bacterium]|jgi:spore germination protein GerM|nr:GerMN domain-containing protein [Spirochaetaceae bacterium]
MKKAGKRKKSKNAYIIPLFWVAFAGVIVLLFVVNMPRIRQTVNATRLGERIGGVPPEVEDGIPEIEPVAPVINEEDYPSLEDALAHLNDAITGQESQNAAKNPAVPADIRERSVYFMRMDTDGLLVRTEEKRQMAHSSTPLLDTINVLLAGTTAAEEARGITTLIPPATVLIDAAIRGNTAVLNFNENFMFNNYGAEGYLAQLRQIIWTATEFPSVKNVQFLIEGQRIDFLGDNIRLDQPISREDLGRF